MGAAKPLSGGRARRQKIFFPIYCALLKVKWGEQCGGGPWCEWGVFPHPQAPHPIVTPLSLCLYFSRTGLHQHEAVDVPNHHAPSIHPPLCRVGGVLCLPRLLHHLVLSPLRHLVQHRVQLRQGLLGNITVDVLPAVLRSHGLLFLQHPCSNGEGNCVVRPSHRWS